MLTASVLALGTVLAGVSAVQATGTSQDQKAATTPQAGAVDAKTLLGRSIKNHAGDTIGKVDSVVIDKDGNARFVIVGVGGFLGIGKKEVALPWDSLQIDQGGESVR